MVANTIDFEPIGRRGQCQSDESLLTCAHRLGIGINNLCGGQGTCHSCKVQLLSGSSSKPSSGEREVFSSQELKDGWRLACQTYPTSDCKLSVPPESMTTVQRTQVEGLEVTAKLEPSVSVYQIKLTAPKLSNVQADADNLLQTLNQQYHLVCQKFDIDVLRTSSPKLRSWNWQCQVSVRNDEVVSLTSWPSPQLGLAIDLGTTKIAGYLLDLSDGRTLATKGMMNPQISYGEDVISRINSVTRSPTNGKQMQKLAIEALNQLIDDLYTEAGVKKEEIVETVVVGNTAMHHLLVGLPVKQLTLSPFVPAVSMALDIKARDLGLHIAPGAYVHLLPNVAGFIGADHVAMLLETKVQQTEGLVIAMDIGTNTEVSLIENKKISSASCASGPAFEGYHIKHGMRAASGAIERVQIAGNNVRYQTIDGISPVGICGSGIIDAVAQLYLSGVIDKGGKMKDGHPRVRTRKKKREFLLVSDKEQDGQPDIVITQGDIREVQLAKAAIRTGIQTLLDTTGHTDEEIDHFIIAGAFGTYISISSAITIGMLPPIPLNRFQQVGNAAGMGAKLALISLSKRAQANALASQVHYIELGSAPNFTETFIQAGYMGRYRITNGKREDLY